MEGLQYEVELCRPIQQLSLMPGQETELSAPPILPPTSVPTSVPSLMNSNGHEATARPNTISLFPPFNPTLDHLHDSPSLSIRHE